MDISPQTAHHLQINHDLMAVTEQVTADMLHSVTDKHINRLRFPGEIEQIFLQFYDIKIIRWHKLVGKISILCFAIWFLISLFFPVIGIIPINLRHNIILTLSVIIISCTALYSSDKIPFLLHQRISSIIVMHIINYIIWVRLGYNMLLPAFLSMFIGRLLIIVLLRLRFWDATIFTFVFNVALYVLLWSHNKSFYITTLSDTILVTLITIGMIYLLEHEVRREFLHVATIHHLAIHDSLTGVFNRRHFMNQMDKEVALAHRYQLPLTMLMIDIDSFKQVNDRYGHAAGDEALRVISQCCIQELRIADYFGRIGGEEFAVLLPNTDLTGAIELAERLRTKIAAIAIKNDEHTFSCTLSVGVTQLKQSDQVSTALLDRADEGLYQAKHNGKNQVVAI